MNESLTDEEKQLLKTILLVFAGLVSMIGIFLLVTIVFTQTQGALMPALNVHHNWLLTGAAVLSFACTVSAKRYMMKSVQTVKDLPDSLPGKLIRYRSSLIIYMAISEVPILACLVLSLLTGNFVFQVFSAVLLGYLLAELPRREKVLAKLL